MEFDGLKIGFAITGSYCTLHEIIKILKHLVDEGADVTPIISYSVESVDTRFGKAEDWMRQFQEITKKKPIHTIPKLSRLGLRRCLIVL